MYYCSDFKYGEPQWSKELFEKARLRFYCLRLFVNFEKSSVIFAEMMIFKRLLYFNALFIINNSQIKWKLVLYRNLKRLQIKEAKPENQTQKNWRTCPPSSWLKEHGAGTGIFLYEKVLKLGGWKSTPLTCAVAPNNKKYTILTLCYSLTVSIPHANYEGSLVCLKNGHKRR